MTSRRIFCALLRWVALGSAVLGLALAPAIAAPDWVLAAAAQPTPEFADAAPVLILLDETTTDVNAAGVAKIRRRVVLRILSNNGRSFAEAYAPYTNRHSRVQRATAWLVRKGEDVKSRSGRDWVDRAADTRHALYSDERYKYIDRSDDAVAGDVFAAETIVENPLLTSTLLYSWGWQQPVILERYQVTVPAGFRLEQLHPGELSEIRRADAGPNALAWEWRNQQYVRLEPDSPTAHGHPLLSLRIEPPADASQFRPATLRTWTEVADWIASLNDGQCDSSPALVELARSLTADCATPIERIRALASYVQKLRYVGRNDRLGEGHGYQAHKASEVLAAGYGDCKDKANLLAALLQTIGIQAHVAGARIGDDREILPEVPTAGQFDHAIAAIEVGPEIQVPAVVDTPPWGRLLFFDATDPFTQVGDLPLALQGTRVFVQQRGSGELTLLPRIDPAAGHRKRRRAVVELDALGTCRIRVEVNGFGRMGARERMHQFTRTSEQRFREHVVTALSDRLRTGQMESIERLDDPQAGCTGFSFVVIKPGFLQMLPGGLAVAPIDVFDRSDVPALSLTERRLPLRWPAVALEDEIEFSVPSFYVVEETPAPFELTSRFGSYQRQLAVADGKAIYRRKLVLQPQTVEPADYAQLKKFAAEIAKADRASLLLRRVDQSAASAAVPAR